MSTKHIENWERLGQFVAQAMKARGVPGAVVGVRYEGTTHTAGFGVTNVDHPLAVTDETLFQIGSITKTFTGTAMMRLVERGQLELDATVRTYLPEFKVADEAASAGATIRHLLTHMGGWVGDFFHDTGPGADALPRYVAEMAELEQLAPLSTVFSYNNSGFCLAGRVIEAVTKQPYEDVLRELVFGPLGLNHTFFEPGAIMVHRFAVGHLGDAQAARVAQPWPLPRAVWPAGGITCSVQDLLRYAAFHMGDGRTDGQQVLGSDSLRQMQTPQVTLWKDEQWGLTWRLGVVAGTRLMGHAGGTKGQVSLLTLVPEHKLAVAVFTNSGNGGFVTRDVTRWVLREYLGMEESDPEPMDVSEDALRPFVGRYSRPYAEVELGLLCGRLVGQVVYKKGFPSQYVPPQPPPAPATLALCEPDRLLVVDGVMKDGLADVIRNADGSIGWLRFQRRVHRRLT